MIGLFATAVVLGLLRLSASPRWKLKPVWRMSRRLRKFVLTLRLCVSVGWLGAAKATDEQSIRVRPRYR